MQKILFIHLPKEQEPFIRFIPLGLIPLANLLKKQHKVEILNYFLEKKLNNNFNLIGYIKKNNFKIICFDLQWHYQTTKVIDTAKEIKEEIKNIKIIIGGQTASFFYKDIIKFPFVDFVIRGEAELPLVELIKNINSRKKDFYNIPNIVWKKGNKVIENDFSYYADEGILNKLDFTDLTILKNREEYLLLGLEKNKANNKWLFFYNPGRGCNVNCSFCSGSRDSQKMISSREKVIFVNQEKVIKELKKLSKKGLGVWYVSFDPSSYDYYLELFKKIRKNKIKIRCKFECWKLPTKEFIDEFVKTFVKGSEIVISPESGSEKVRAKNKGFYYTNKALIETLNYLRNKKINTVLYFTAGLPFETLDDFTETLKLVNFLKTYKNIFIYAVPIEIEPASPMFLNPKKYGIKLKRKTFDDFYKAHKKRSMLGYETPYFKEDEIPELTELILATARCRMKRPVFLKVLEEFPEKEKLIIKDLWGLCSICRFFKECWTKT